MDNMCMDILPSALKNDKIHNIKIGSMCMILCRMHLQHKS